MWKKCHFFLFILSLSYIVIISIFLVLVLFRNSMIHFEKHKSCLFWLTVAFCFTVVYIFGQRWIWQMYCFTICLFSLFIKICCELRICYHNQHETFNRSISNMLIMSKDLFISHHIQSSHPMYYSAGKKKKKVSHCSRKQVSTGFCMITLPVIASKRLAL